MRHLYLLFFLYFVSQVSTAQSPITSKIIDKETKEPIPYATIVSGNNSGLISNEEGQFSFTKTKSTTDSLQISSMGYENQTIAIHALDSIIYLTPKSFELSTVFLNDKNLTPEEIIDEVQKNVSKNHLHDYSKKKFFYRASFSQKYQKMDFGFQKSSIKTIDKRLIDSIANSFPDHVSVFFENLCESYGNHEPEFKLDILRALTLEDDSQATTLTEFQERMEQLLQENVKPDSYLKIKSGLLGTKVPLDSIIEDQKTKDARKKRYETKEYFNYRKWSVHQVLDHLFYHKKSDVDVIKNAGRYDFELLEYQEIGEDLAYVLTFKPKKKANFKGKLYVNTDDFAVLRLDYTSAKPVYDKKFNMFGVNYNHLTYGGTMIFEKDADNFYHVKYINQERSESFAMNRPLKIIEKNKYVRGRRKQNEVKLELDVKMYNTIKRELAVYKNTALTARDASNHKENKTVKIHKATAYDPEFWKGYTILEPNQMIRQYKVVKTE